MELLNPALNWRYATKQFDPQRKLSNEQVDSILAAGNLSATSYGLQPYQFLLIEDQSFRESLVSCCYNQRQVVDASHLIVIAIRTDIDEVFIRDFISLTEAQRNLTAGSLTGYGDLIIKSIMSFSENARLDWAARQAYLALGTMLAACAAMHVDACPMEGFLPHEFNQRLNLTDRNLHCQLLLPVGYRAESDETQHLPKVRRPLEEMVIRIS